MEDTIKKNLELMIRDDFSDGSFRRCILSESLGGNAGHIGLNNKEYSCGGANFVYDSESGEILYFGNYPDIHKDIKQKLVAGKAKESIFRVAVEFGEDSSNVRFRIVEHYFNGNVEGNSVKTIIETVKRYNEKYGFD